MVYRTKQLALLCVLLLSSEPAAIQEESHKYVIKGRVVDEHGYPVTHASVILQPSVLQKTWESWVIYHETDSEGRFCIEETASHPIQKWILYVVVPPPPDADVPIAPPLRGLRNNYKAFAGLPILMNKGGDVDLGDVLSQVRYGLVLIELLDHSGKPLFTESTEENKLPYIWIRVRDVQGNLVGEESVVRKAFRKAESAIAVALPEGKWQIEAALEANNMAWHTLAQPILVESLTEPLKVTLRLGSRQSQVPRESHSYIPEDAQRELERLNIPYSEDSFIKAAQNDNLRVIELFLAAGMNPNVKTKNGKTVLMVATSRGFTEIVRALLREGANVNVQDNYGTTPLMVAATAPNSDIVKILLDNGADANAKDKDGKTALMLAAANGQINNVRYLLTAGADVNAKDKDGKTALTWANEFGRADIVELLKQAGARE